MKSWVNGKVQDGVPSRGWALRQVIATVCTTVHIKAWFSYATIFVFWDLFQVNCPWKMRTHLYSISTNSLHRVTTHAALGFNFTLDWPWIRYYSGTSGLFADAQLQIFLCSCSSLCTCAVISMERCICQWWRTEGHLLHWFGRDPDTGRTPGKRSLCRLQRS